MSKLKESVEKAKAHIVALETELVSLEEKGVKAAAARARKVCQEIKVLMQGLRGDIQDHKESLSDKK